MKNWIPFALLGLLYLSAACAPKQEDPPEAVTLTPDEIRAAVEGAMDTGADPCSDFYRYACGNWLKENEIPADQSRWTRGSELQEANRERLRKILDGFVASPPSDPEMRKLSRYYGSCMDTAAIDAGGYDPIKPWLAKADTVDSRSALMSMVGELHKHSIDVLFSPAVFPDLGNPDLNIVNVFQGGLGLPDRDYYLGDAERYEQARKGYLAHIAAMMKMVGESDDQAAGTARAVLDFETRLAKIAWPRAVARNPNKIYNKIDLSGLREIAQGLDWDAWLRSAGFPDFTDLNVGMPDYFHALPALVDDTDTATLRSYLRWHIISEFSPLLASPFEKEHFEFYGKQLQGRAEDEVRWKKCVSRTDEAAGELLGKAFVERYFAGDSKDKALKMLHGIENAFTAALPDLGWMDQATRERAIEKRNALTEKIGYPDRWRDYADLKIEDQPYFDNAMEAIRFKSARNMAKIGKPVDRTEWAMSPPTVNAYYNPLANEMVFPAGILQAPFFNKDFPPAMDYGAVGMVMGHELSHGFDDQGRKFDKTGKLTEWWEPEVVAAFEERTRCVEELYDGFEAVPGVRLNGRLTLGENIADLGGIKRAFEAYKAAAAETAGAGPEIGGLDEDQLFFVAYAQVWCAKVRPEMASQLAVTDPHSPPRWRVIAPLANFPAFAEAFSCGEGTPMNPEKKCEVW